MNLIHRNRFRGSLQVFAILFRCGPPSPPEKGDRSGASLGEARAQTREAIVVDEIHPTDALSRLIITKSRSPKTSALSYLPLIYQPHRQTFLFYKIPIWVALLLLLHFIPKQHFILVHIAEKTHHS